MQKTIERQGTLDVYEKALSAETRQQMNNIRKYAKFGVKNPWGACYNYKIK